MAGDKVHKVALAKTVSERALEQLLKGKCEILDKELHFQIIQSVKIFQRLYF